MHRSLQHAILSLRLCRSLYLSRLRHRIIGRHVTHALTETPEGLFLVGIEDSVVGRTLATSGGYNREHLEALRPTLDRDSRVLVVGAHIGTMVFPLAKLAREVGAVEANPDTFRTLELNRRLNDARNVRLIGCAASDHDGYVQFVKNTHNSGGSKVLPKAHAFEFFYDSPEVVKVRAARLDDLLPGFQPTHCILDIEGSEYAALKGMPRLLSACEVLLIEVMPSHLQNVAGVSLDQFLSAIPERFACFARIGSSAVHDRSELRNVIESVGSFSGADLLFTTHGRSFRVSPSADRLSYSSAPSVDCRG